MKLAICSDHAGYKLKSLLIDYINDAAPYIVGKDIEVIDLGTDSEESVDYPDFAHRLAEVCTIQGCKGIAICGTGNGMAMTLNTHQDIRAGIAWVPEVARLTRAHNDANVLVLPARFISTIDAYDSLASL